jgi:hypothetical protein
MTDSETVPIPVPQELSRRAARRLIQRAVVLVGRDRHVRQNIREARLSMAWVLEDWQFEWTVHLDRGKLEFDRRPVKHPNLTLTWREAAAFFASATTGRENRDDYSIEGDRDLRRYGELVWKSLRVELGKVLRFPFDDDGVRLA